MRVASPFPTFSILLPEDLLENHVDQVFSYWKKDDSCLLQLRSVGRLTIQKSAKQCLLQQILFSDSWKPFELPRKPHGCESEAATTNVDGTSYLHAYLVWPAFTVHATVSRQGQLDSCQWVWDLLGTVQGVVMDSIVAVHSTL